MKTLHISDKVRLPLGGAAIATPVLFLEAGR